jgi:hypothetical protein
MIPRAKSGPKPKSRRPRRPPTEPSRLGLVPLFRPGEGFGPDDPSDAVPSKDERARIRSILSKALENTCGKHDIEIFFGRAIPAITTYMWNCDQKPNFDQAKAKKLIAKASEAIQKACTKVEEIGAWPELSGYLEAAYLAEPKSYADYKQRRSTCRLIFNNAFRSLQTFATILEFGDEATTRWQQSLRNELADRFAEEIADALKRWIGRVPTCSSFNPNSSPHELAAVFQAINGQILKPHQRSDFIERGKKIVRRMNRELGKEPKKRQSRWS